MCNNYCRSQNMEAASHSGSHAAVGVDVNPRPVGLSWQSWEKHKHLLTWTQPIICPICTALRAHVPKCLYLLYDSNLPSLRPLWNHCFPLGGVMNPSAWWCLQAASPHRAHLFCESAVSTTDLLGIAGTGRGLLFMSAHISPVLPGVASSLCVG